MKINLKCLLLGLAGFTFTGTVVAADYFLANGASDTISTNVVYEKMDVYGDLSVYVPGGTSSSKKKSVGFTSSLNLIGGTLTVDSNGGGEYFQFGYHGSNDGYKPTVNLTNNVDGTYGSILIKNINTTVDTGLCCEKLNLLKESEVTAPENGIIDFARIENGALFVRQLYNYTSCTGRVTIAGGGSSYFCRRGRSSQSAFFDRGPFIVRLEDSSTWCCYTYNNRGDFNAENQVVASVGVGTVAFRQRAYDKLNNDTFVFRKGAYLNHLGRITFSHDNTTYPTYFDFESSEIIGPNVTNISVTTSTYKEPMRVRFLANVVQTVKNISIAGAGPYVTGSAGSKLRINADDGDRTVKLNIKSGDPLTVEKIGGYEMVVSATTNFSHLVISEGAVRITNPCVIENLTMKKGAVLIADGCEVRVCADDENIEQAFSTVNGGKIILVSTGRTMHYDPSALQGFLHFDGGTNIYSRYGIDKKRWRWTFFSINGGPACFRNRALYLFGPGGSWENEGLGYDSTRATEMTTTVLAANKSRWWCHSSTNLAADKANFDYAALKYLERWFKMGYAGNNCTVLSTPVVNPDDPTSWVGVEMHLRSTAKPITGYNMRAHAPSLYANGWRVEVSDDGLNWDLVEVRSNQVFNIKDYYYTYDNVALLKSTFNAKELFHFTGYRTDGLTPSEESVALQVDGGAVVDLRAFTGGQALNALTVDCAAGTGIIQGAKIAESGVLTIVNTEALSDWATLPLSLPEAIDGANLRNWSVVVDGETKALRAVLSADGSLKLTSRGTVLFLR